MPLSRYRAASTATDIRYATGSCDLGTALIAATPRGVCAIMLGDSPEPLVEDLRRRFPAARLIEAATDPEFARAFAQIVRMIESPAQSFDLPLDVYGTDFQRRVWEALRAIPIGTTLTYSELAERIGQPRAVRATASACGANPVAVAIPCHRVVGRDGKLTGYRWGIERKRALLTREGHDPAAPARVHAAS